MTQAKVSYTKMFPVLILLIAKSTVLAELTCAWNETNHYVNKRFDPYPSRLPGEHKILPRIDPVVYQDWREGAPLSKENFDAFENNGFLILPKFFSEQEVEEMKKEAEKMRDSYEKLPKELVIFEANTDSTVRSIFRIFEESRIFQKFASDPRLLNMVKYILNDTVFMYQSRVNFKAGITGRRFFWHSDFDTWHNEDGMPRMRGVSVIILLTENFEQNGPLLLVPGTHKHFISCPKNNVDSERNITAYLKERSASPTPSPEIITKFVQGFIRKILIYERAESKANRFWSILNLGMKTTQERLYCEVQGRHTESFLNEPKANKIQKPFNGGEPRPYYLANREENPEIF